MLVDKPYNEGGSGGSFNDGADTGGDRGVIAVEPGAGVMVLAGTVGGYDGQASVCQGNSGSGNGVRNRGGVSGSGGGNRGGRQKPVISFHCQTERHVRS